MNKTKEKILIVFAPVLLIFLALMLMPDVRNFLQDFDVAISVGAMVTVLIYLFRRK